MADLHISSVTVASGTTSSADIHISSVSVATNPTTLEPFDRYVLPTGSWSYTSGPAVTITGGNTFTVPATAAGGTLVLTETGGSTLSFTVLPHTFFLAKSSAWKGAQFFADAPDATPAAPTTAMPVGDLPGWTQVVAEDFLTAVPEGGFVANTSGVLVNTGGGTAGYNAYGPGAPGGAKLTMYPLSWATTGTRTTSGTGVWDEGIVSVSNSTLKIAMRTRTTAVGTFPRGAAVKPVLPSGSYNFGPYGMYQIRVRTTGVNVNPSNYHCLLLAIDSNNWDAGELDWMECEAAGTLSGWYHYKVPAGTRAGGSDPKIRATSPKVMTDWNIVTVKWEPGKMYWGVRGDTDEADYVALNSTTSVPTDPMAVLLQMEPAVGTTPGSSTTATCEVDWFVMYDRVAVVEPPPNTITAGPVTLSVSGTTVNVNGSITTTASTVFDGLNISIARDTTGYPWIGSTAFANGALVNGTRALSGSLSVADGNYVAYVSYSLDGGVTYTTGPKTQFTITSSGTVSGAYPTKSLAVYAMRWSDSQGPLSAVPAKCNVVRLAFANALPLRMTGWGPEGEAASLASLTALRARGCKISVSIGGGGYAIDLSNTSARVADMQFIASQLGGIDGMDIDIEGSSIVQSQVLAFAAGCKAIFGPNFHVTMVPNGSNISQYLPVAVALHNAGNLDAFGQQFYDAPVSLAAAKGRIQEAINAGLPVSKYEVGMMIANDASHWTNAQCLSYMTDIRNTWPTIKGAYLWENSRAGTAQWATDIAGVLGI
jgi:hypothetical protein